jgi:hypothetical protein
MVQLLGPACFRLEASYGSHDIVGLHALCQAAGLIGTAGSVKLTRIDYLCGK